MVVIVGSQSIDISTAVKRVVEYVTSDDYLFGTYDAYRTNNDPNVLADGDLLAPLLLNVQVRVRSYRKLQRWKRQIEQALAQLPDVDLGDATDSDIDKVGACFDVLDGEPHMGVTLAKVLHRKHPRLLPLYDRNVYACYVPERLPAATDRAWSDFIRLLATEMRRDLADHREAWDDICSEANQARDDPPELTPLRALDVLAWWTNGVGGDPADPQQLHPSPE
ncbi:MAG: hypothetical protein QOI10_3808 [Solirubrobacterales bacterium]|nr:hypothetical protein [Solirubrobacterales bacterium]